MFGNPIFETGKTPFLSFCSFTLLLHILHIRVFLSADRREIAILVSNQPLNSTINVVLYCFFLAISIAVLLIIYINYYYLVWYTIVSISDFFLILMFNLMLGSMFKGLTFKVCSLYKGFISNFRSNTPINFLLNSIKFL